MWQTVEKPVAFPEKIAFADICEAIFLDVATRQAKETKRHITTRLTKNTAVRF